MSKIVIAEFNEFKVVLNEDGWLNATDIAVKYGKIASNWLKLESTTEYIAALE